MMTDSFFSFFDNLLRARRYASHDKRAGTSSIMRNVVLSFGLGVICVCAGCAGSRAPETSTPRDVTAAAPVVLEFPADQATQTRQAFAALLRAQGITDSSAQPTLFPITNTLAALPAQGVKKVHFIDGRTPHSLLLEVFTNTGVGTEIVT